MKDKIISMYEIGKKSTNQIADELSIPKSKVQWALKSRKVKMRKIVDNPKYTINSDYFSVIDSESKAYFLGLLDADGCNHGDGRITISLQEGDKNILESFKKYLNTERPLYLRKKQKENHQNQWILHIKNKKIAEDLNNLGMTPRKSLSLQFPNVNQVPEHLLNHFIRGYFDGDGTITQVKDTKQFSVSLCVSEAFAKIYKELVQQTLDINVSIFQAKNNKIHYASIGGGRQVLKFLDWMYRNSTIFLNRKKDKYLDLKNYFESYQKPYSSKYQGVYYYKQNRKFGAYCTIDKKRKTLGMFLSEKDAAIAYDNFVINNKLNRKLNFESMENIENDSKILNRPLLESPPSDTIQDTKAVQTIAF